MNARAVAQKGAQARERPGRALFIAALLCSALAWSCKGPSKDEQSPPRGAIQLDVFAAASLREAFTAIEKSFESTHAGADVVLHFAGSQELRTQIEQGAHADVFASADRANMAKLESAGLVSSSRNFARNVPVIVVAEAAKEKIHALSDAPSAGRLVIGTPEVPIGKYTEAILERASAHYDSGFRDRFLKEVVSKELNVKQVLAKVRLGEANAGIVYRTDARAEPSLTVIEIPVELNVIGDYPIATLKGARDEATARAWVELVCSRIGQDILKAHGFLPAQTTP